MSRRDADEGCTYCGSGRHVLADCDRRDLDPEERSEEEYLSQLSETEKEQ